MPLFWLGRPWQTKMTIYLITEPHTISNKLHGFPRGTTLVYDREIASNKPGPRAAIIASKDTQVTTLSQWCHRDCAVGLAQINGRLTVLASVYLDIRKPVRPQWLDDLVRMAESKSYPIIICADSNAHSSLFGPDNNARGDELEDFVLHHGLGVENKGSTPTFQTKRGSNMIGTFIDVTLSRGLPHPVQNWRVLTEYNGSDHNTIAFCLQKPKNPPVLIRPWSKADWPLFKQTLGESDFRIPVAMSMKKLDRAVDNLYAKIEHALDVACPKIRVTQRTKNTHWATDTHSKLKQNVTNLYRTAKKTNSQDDWTAYKRADKHFKTVCKRDKNKAWRQYKESLQTSKETATLVKLAQRTSQPEINTLTKADGTASDPGKDTVDLLTGTHFPEATDVKRVTYNNRRNETTQNIDDKYRSWINISMVRRALGGFEKKKSPGPDGIKPLLFEHLPDAFLNTLVTLYKSCIHLAYTCLLYTSPSPRDRQKSRMPSSA